ncbi:MAG: hypothetical protein KIT31_25700, partial [Deltaproteobacteria bacterium]|nr:hypothetical protein [Deltaproteobacteria bacterium]
ARAELRLVRTAASVPEVRELVIHPSGKDDPLPAKELGAFHRFIFAAGDRALQFFVDTHLPCRLGGHLKALGMNTRRIDVVTKRRTDDILVRWHPDPAFVGDGDLGRCVVTDTEMEILDLICFEDERVRPSSVNMIDAVAHTLTGNEDILLIELGVYVDPSYPGDPVARSQRRADEVRRMLVERGVAPGRVTAAGYGARDGRLQPAGENDKRELLGLSDARCPRAPGDMVSFMILKRATDR